MPTAGEQVYDDVDATDYGLADNVSNANMLGYNGTFGGIGVSLGYTKDSTDADTSWVLTYDGLMDGLSVGVGMGENGTTQDLSTIWAKYTAGSITVGFQKSEVDNTGSTNDEESPENNENDEEKKDNESNEESPNNNENDEEKNDTESDEEAKDTESEGEDIS